MAQDSNSKARTVPPWFPIYLEEKGVLQNLDFARSVMDRVLSGEYPRLKDEEILSLKFLERMAREVLDEEISADLVVIEMTPKEDFLEENCLELPEDRKYHCWVLRNPTYVEKDSKIAALACCLINDKRSYDDISVIVLPGENLPPEGTRILQPGVIPVEDYLHIHRGLIGKMVDIEARIPAKLIFSGSEEDISFDAEAWFAQADDADLQSLIDCGFGDDYASDNVVEFYAEWRPEIGRAINNSDGYEAYIDPKKAIEYILDRQKDGLHENVDLKDCIDRYMSGLYPSG